MVRRTDAYRRALALTPDYKLATDGLESIRKRLTPLGIAAREGATGLIASAEIFRFYSSPFELLQVKATESIAHLDVRTIQRAKKRLLQELDLNDGKVSWLHDHQFDKSRAFEVDSALDDPLMRQFHWAVFQDTPLLMFLTRGDIGLFLCVDDYFPRDTLQLLDVEPAFRTFLSKAFAQQYNMLLTRAVERRLFPVIEVLFDGRRWVEPADQDICFDGARQHVRTLIEQAEELVRQSTHVHIPASQVANYLSCNSIPQLLNLLPAAFREEQRQMVWALRQLAIACNNRHNDSEGSAQILNSCKSFRFRGVELDTKLEEDGRAIQGVLAEQRKHTFSAPLRQGCVVSVSHTEARVGDAFIPPTDVTAVRWGVYSRSVNGIEVERSFSLVLRGDRSTIRIAWEKRGLLATTLGLFQARGEVVPITEMTVAEQELMFQKLVDAVLHNFVSPLASRLVERIDAGEALSIGPCTLSRSGIAFRSGTMFFRKDYLLPWTDCSIRMQSGQVVVGSRTNQKARIAMPMKDTDNGVLLPIICAAMNERST